MKLCLLATLFQAQEQGSILAVAEFSFHHSSVLWCRVSAWPSSTNSDQHFIMPLYNQLRHLSQQVESHSLCYSYTEPKW